MTVWTVPARVTRVIDGDTIVADLDLGWGLWRINEHVRIIGVNCPELSTGQPGADAKAFTEVWLGALPRQVTLVSHKLDKYGRTLGDLFTGPTSGLGLSASLLAAGMAVPMKE